MNKNFIERDHEILTVEELLSLRKKAKEDGLKVIMTNGCFDILHSGHVTYLKEARELGDILIVAVNTDASVSRLKGPTRPINNTEERMNSAYATATLTAAGVDLKLTNNVTSAQTVSINTKNVVFLDMTVTSSNEMDITEYYVKFPLT